MIALPDKTGTLVAVGDIVFVDDADFCGNFSGRGQVESIAGGEFFIRPTRGEWIKGLATSWFPPTRVTFFSGRAGLNRWPSPSKDSKPTNPKDAVGSDKLPLHLWPETATVMGTLGMLDGMLKYGRANWRSAGIRSSIYADAIKRHVNAWFEGEDIDPDSGVPHLAHVLACVAIIVDAQAAGNLTDDRQFPGGYRQLIDELTPHVKRLKEKHADKSPHHYTIGDA